MFQTGISWKICYWLHFSDFPFECTTMDKGGAECLTCYLSSYKIIIIRESEIFWYLKELIRSLSNIYKQIFAFKIYIIIWGIIEEICFSVVDYRLFIVVMKLLGIWDISKRLCLYVVIFAPGGKTLIDAPRSIYTECKELVLYELYGRWVRLETLHTYAHTARSTGAIP